MFDITPIGWVRGGRIEAADDDWATVEATIELDTTHFGAESLAGLEEFSHIDVIYLFHEVVATAIETGARIGCATAA